MIVVGGHGSMARLWQTRGDRLRAALSAVASAGTTYKAKNTLKLEGHLEAIVKLSRSSPDIYPITCIINRKVKVQRKSEGLWKNVVTGLTNGSGRLSTDIPDKAGKVPFCGPPEDFRLDDLHEDRLGRSHPQPRLIRPSVQTEMRQAKP